jgi:catechol 2,3-dioxygenase-like lactoylglutathione lyase family enzyme
MKIKLNHVTLICTDFEKSLEFSKLLGFDLIVLSEPKYARFICPGSEETLSIEFTGETVEAPRAELFFECETIDETVVELEEKGFTFDQQPTDMSYLWREARLLDPDGHNIRLYKAGKNRLDPPWRINA